MKPSFKYAGLALIVIFLSLFMLDTKVLGRYFTSSAIDMISSDQVSISIQDPDLHLLGVTGSELNILFPKTLLSVPLRSPRVDVSFKSLLSLNPRTKISAKVFNGQLDAELTSGREIKITAKSFQMELASIPQFAALGVTNGLLSLNFDPLIIGDNLIQTLDAQVDIDKLRKPQESTIQGKLIGSPLDITIPKIESFTGHAKIMIENSTINFQPVEIKSSLAAINGDFKGSINKEGRIVGGKGQFSINLSNAGTREFGNFLPLLSSGKLKKSDKSFILKLEVSPSGTIARAVAN
ncbi:MAG: hypothetical protein R3A13_10645 [Bdellovibrionota bacterium]